MPFEFDLNSMFGGGGGQAGGFPLDDLLRQFQGAGQTGNGGFGGQPPFGRQGGPRRDIKGDDIKG